MKKLSRIGLKGGEKMDKGYIEYICSLAKLEYDEKDSDRIIGKMKAFDKYAEKLADIDTKDIKPLVNVNETINVLREDVVMPSLERNIILENAPEKLYGCIKVSKIIE